MNAFLVFDDDQFKTQPHHLNLKMEFTLKNGPNPINFYSINNGKFIPLKFKNILIKLTINP